ncbi:cytochrome c oxidase assembly protein [Aureimonas sp. AU4]|uniref:cytochrome c oxidase assembly protein n=1 Tax=Aureimonas sp. AU4 TaxID=1638163 RepID=UPI000786340E|nr:cytochrome c oxidase assembly protein [Aureimonas sp. AU4]
MRALTAFLCLLAPPALAHGGHDHAAQDFSWTLDPLIVLPLALVAFLHAMGRSALLTKSGRGRASLVRRARLFWLGLAILALALVSPLHAAGERSFVLHMVEHEILMLVATPLLVLGEPLPVMLWAFPPPWRRRFGRLGADLGSSLAWRISSSLVGATVLQAATLWLWHMPALFNRALESDMWHIAQHLSFVVSALLFWNAMLGRRGARGTRAGQPALAALCLFLTSLVGGALGALMAVSESPWFEAYARLGEAPFGLSAAEDQQLAGLVMWVPGGLVHVGAALLVGAKLLTSRKETVGAR